MKKGAKIEDTTVKAFNSCTSSHFFSPHILVTTSQPCNLNGSTIHSVYTILYTGTDPTAAWHSSWTVQP